MSNTVSRRRAMQDFVAAACGVATAPVVLRGQATPIVVAGRRVEIVVGSISSSTARITVVPTSDPGRDVPDDGVLDAEAEARPLSRAREVFAPVRAGELVVRFTTDPPTIHVDTPFGDVVQRLRLDAKAPGLSFLLGKGPLFGLGEGGPQFDRRGSVYQYRNGQGGYQLRTHGARVLVPWLMSADGWGMFVHHPLGEFDLSGDEGRLTPAAESLPIDLFVTASPDPLELMREYARITGLPELPPRWSFGYMQSHRTLSGPEEIKSIARTFRDKKLPCDALIYLGTEFTPSGWNTRNGEFAWKKENFPEPQRMLDELHAQHFRVVLHVVIEGRRMTGGVGEPCTPENAVPSGRTPDDKWPADRAVPCYWPYHKPLYDIGVDGMWPDQGDGLDLPSRLTRIRMYWEGPQQYRPNERPLRCTGMVRRACSAMERSSGPETSTRCGRR